MSLDLFLAFTIYAALVAFKSGSLFGSWFLMISIFYFSALGILNKPSNKFKHADNIS